MGGDLCVYCSVCSVCSVVKKILIFCGHTCPSLGERWHLSKTLNDKVLCVATAQLSFALKNHWCIMGYECLKLCARQSFLNGDKPVGVKRSVCGVMYFLSDGRRYGVRFSSLQHPGVPENPADS